MKRQLQVQAEYLADTDKCRLTILAQSHRESSFSPDTERTHVFIHKNVALATVGSPAIYFGENIRRYTALCLPNNIECLLFLRGWNYDKDNNALAFSAAWWPMIKEAIEAYNNHYSQ